MTVNLLKPAFRVNDIHEFARRQKNFYMRTEDGEILYPVRTTRRPARIDDLLNGGSVYWVVKNQISCRQEIMDIAEIPPDTPEDKAVYLFLCDPKIILTQPLPQKHFQGWRYLKPDRAPKDRGVFDENQKRPPPEMEKDLTELGLL